MEGIFETQSANDKWSIPDSSLKIPAVFSVEKNRSSEGNWDTFAADCGASYRCAFRAVNISDQFTKSGWRVQRFEIFCLEAGTCIKIGQFAIIIAKQRRIFCDQLQLLPNAADLWCEVMQAVLRVLGPGSYCYGSEWSTECSREADSLKLVGVTIERIRRAYLEAVDFNRWTSWDGYWRALSANVRRNYNKESRDDAHLRLAECRSRDLLKNLLITLVIRRHTLSQKAVNGSLFARSVKSIVRTLSLLNHASMVIYRSEKSITAYSSCIEFGLNTFYLEGGSRRNGGGNSDWFLLVSTIRRAFERSGGQGLFVMGPVDDETMNTPEWAGLALSRQHCRVTQRPVSVLYFDYCENQ